MKSKLETKQHLHSFLNFVVTQFNSKIQILRSDNGIEFQMLDSFMPMIVLSINLAVLRHHSRQVLLKGSTNIF